MRKQPKSLQKLYQGKVKILWFSIIVVSQMALVKAMKNHLHTDVEEMDELFSMEKNRHNFAINFYKHDNQYRKGLHNELENLKRKRKEQAIIMNRKQNPTAYKKLLEERRKKQMNQMEDKRKNLNNLDMEKRLREAYEQEIRDQERQMLKEKHKRIYTHDYKQENKNHEIRDNRIHYMERENQSQKNNHRDFQNSTEDLQSNYENAEDLMEKIEHHDKIKYQGKRIDYQKLNNKRNGKFDHKEKDKRTVQKKQNNKFNWDEMVDDVFDQHYHNLNGQKRQFRVLIAQRCLI